MFGQEQSGNLFGENGTCTVQRAGGNLAVGEGSHRGGSSSTDWELHVGGGRMEGLRVRLWRTPQAAGSHSTKMGKEYLLAEGCSVSGT